MKRTLIILALAFLITPAQAQDADHRWIRKSLVTSCEWWGNCYQYYRYHDWRDRHERVRVYRRYRTPEVRSWVYRDDRRDDYHRSSRDDKAQCLSAVVDVLSTEHQSEDNAREAARKLWMAKVQWAQGGQYMDLDQAADVRWRCGPSNAHDTISGRIAEAAGALTGKPGQNQRCALWARPCKAEREFERGREARGRR